MLEIVLHWTFLAITAYGVGVGVLRGIARTGPVAPDLTILTGFASLSVMAALISFIHPVNERVSLAAFALALGVLVWQRQAIARDWAQRWKHWRTLRWFGPVFSVVALLAVLVFATAEPMAYDTGLYHYQNILWNTSYPVVPGLANLHGRFAFNSSFFLLQALFQWDDLKSDVFFAANSFLLLLVALRGAYALGSWLVHKDWPMAAWTALVFVGAILFFAAHSSSAQNDFAVMLVTVYLWLLIADRQASLSHTDFTIIALLTCWLITIKFSMLPMVLLPLALILRDWSTADWKPRVKVFLTVGLVFLVPMLVRSVILSGYLIYPMASLDLFHPDWKVPGALVERESMWIRAWARMPYRDAGEVLNMSMLEWLPDWWRAQVYYVKLLLLLTVASPVLWVIASRRSHMRSSIGRYELHVAVIMWLALLVWFFSAPDVRFGMGAMIVCALFTVRLIPLLLGSAKWRQVFEAAAVLGFLALTGYHTIGTVADVQTWKSRVISPKSLKSVDTREQQASNFVLLMPAVGDQCFCAPLPCSPYLREHITLRGTSLAEGFRIEETTAVDVPEGN